MIKIQENIKQGRKFVITTNILIIVGIILFLFFKPVSIILGLTSIILSIFLKIKFKKVIREYSKWLKTDEGKEFAFQNASENKKKTIIRQKRIAENKANDLAHCPKCGSTSLSAHKKGFGIGKAVVGAGLFGPFGLIAGNLGSKKVRITCLNCGNQFKR